MTLPPPGGTPFWSARKILAAIFVAILVIGAAITGLVAYYHPFQSSSSTTPPSPSSPDFKISTTNPQQSPAGSTEKIQLGMTGLNGFSFEASFMLHTAAGLTCQTSSSSNVLTPSTTVDVTCSSDTRGVYLLNITMTSGSLSHFKTVSFNFTAPASITVKGKAGANFDTATDVRFTEDGSSSVASLLSNGNFSIVLPNPGIYQVRVEKNTAGASCSAGTLDLNQSSTGTYISPYYLCNLHYPTTTFASCFPIDAVVNITFVSCTATIFSDSAGTSVGPASGLVDWTTSNPGFTINPATCSPFGSTGMEPTCNISTQITSHNAPIPSQLTLFANYTGDMFHMSSEGHYNETLQSPPLTVTVSGTAKVVTIFSSRVTGIEFKNTVTGAILKAPVTAGSYSIPLANQQSYNVTIVYRNNVTLQPGQCNAGIWTLESPTTTLTKNFQC